MTGMLFLIPDRSVTYKQCVTQKDAKTIWKSTTQSKDEKCRFMGLKKRGNHIAWKMKCTGNSRIDGSGELTFENAAAYHGKIDIDMRSEGDLMKTHVEVSGRHIGDCSDKR